MQLKDNVTPAVLTAAVGLLAPFAPDLSPRALVAAIKSYQTDGTLGSTDPNRIEQPLTRRQVADLLKCSLQTVNAHMNAGRLRRIRLTKKSVRIDPQSLRDLLAGNTSTSTDTESEG